MKLGFIGQGYVGKSYADYFEREGAHEIVRYSLESPYAHNKDRIAECDVVFIGVPTPTTTEGFSADIVSAVLALVGVGKTAVIKSTILPGTTKKMQETYPDRHILYSPEFLSEATAAYDAEHPFSNIIGMPVESSDMRDAAERVLKLLPVAPHSIICTSLEAEIVKYSHNGSGYVQVVFFNLMYDLAQKLGARWEAIEDALKADPMISNRYARPVHKTGRGAGGHCFIKDFRALGSLYGEELAGDAAGKSVFESLEKKNLELLMSTHKDIDLVEGVYGPVDLKKS